MYQIWYRGDGLALQQPGSEQLSLSDSLGTRNLFNWSGSAALFPGATKYTWQCVLHMACLGVLGESWKAEGSVYI